MHINHLEEDNEQGYLIFRRNGMSTKDKIQKILQCLANRLVMKKVWLEFMEKMEMSVGRDGEEPKTLSLEKIKCSVK